MDRLNEFFNLQIKELMATWTSTIDATDLFRCTALTASYCTNLEVAIEAAFGEYNNARHQIKDASRGVRYLADQIAACQSIMKHTCARSSPFEPSDILQRGVNLLNGGVKRFNRVVEDGRRKETLTTRQRRPSPHWTISLL